MLFGRKGYENLEELYKENEKLVYTFFHDYTEDEEMVKEWSQQLWIRVWENFDKFRDKGKKEAQSYLRVMARNLVADYFRDIKRGNDRWGNVEWISSDMAMVEIEAISESQINDIQMESLQEAILALTEADQNLLYLKYDRNLTSRAIGELIGTSDGVVRVNLQRVRDKLRDEAHEILRRKLNED
ncbi:MAG: sigma-70 family RNA polymerase sigma factor [Firmicutes bacterium]|nr:sigma-70 family RNA polymerase sigma factor [Bacillota bacterium]